MTTRADIPSRQILPLIDVALRDVFEDMLSLSVQPVMGLTRLDKTQMIVGSVGFAGEAVTGTVHLHVSDILARKIAAAMLAVNLGEIDAGEQVEDVLREVTNMLGARLQSRLCDAGFRCGLNAPTVSRASVLRLEEDSTHRLMEFVFLCHQEKFLVAVHLKFKDRPDYAHQSA